MAWLATLDARAQHWPTAGRWLYRAVKWALLGLGAWLWIALWWQRFWLLGVLQVGIIGYGLLRELGPHLRGQRGDDPLRGVRDPSGTP